MEEKTKYKISQSSKEIIKYSTAIVLFASLIFFFSIIMSSIASYRNSIYNDNFEATTDIYNGPLRQAAPNLNSISSDSAYYKENKITPELAKKYTENTFLTSTNGGVEIKADFVKKGLMYQPTFKTNFQADYVLKNTLDQESFIAFQFPFPINIESGEISNAKIVVNGEEIKNAKTKFLLSSDNYYDYYGMEVNGMEWVGKINPNTEITISVSYNTVGISLFKYEGIENSKGSQDFNFTAEIIGTRAYDIVEGLSVDNRKFEDSKVTLEWNKADLYNKPVISISVGEKLNPSEQVSRIYFTMTPIYLVFSAIVVFLSAKFGKRIVSLFDLFLVTCIFIVYFPLIHYLSSFTIDPTVDIFSNLNVPQYSMPLYLAFALSFLVVGSMIVYLIGKVSGFKFSLKFIVPSMILFLGFFPLVVTIPEYSMLLVIIGALALITIVIQVRTKVGSAELTN